MPSKPAAKSRTPVQTSVARSAPAAKSTKKATSTVPAGKSAAKTSASAGSSTAKPPSTAAVPKTTAKLTTSKHKPVKKEKTVRDSFNMPADDYALIGALKKRAIKSGREMKKSELLRAGIKALAGMNDTAFAAALGTVASIKTGRPARKKE